MKSIDKQVFPANNMVSGEMLERNLVLAEMVDASIAINFARKLPALYFDLEAKATWT